MPSSKFTYDLPPGAPSPVVKEEHIEYGFIGKLQNLKYEYRDDIRDRAALEKNSRLQIPLIPHAEQQRIASCLSTFDALITAEIQKLAALKAHKKGLMQQLFPSSAELEA